MTEEKSLLKALLNATKEVLNRPAFRLMGSVTKAQALRFSSEILNRVDGFSPQALNLIIDFYTDVKKGSFDREIKKIAEQQQDRYQKILEDSQEKS